MPDTYSWLLRCEEQTICFYSKKYSISKPLLYTLTFSIYLLQIKILFLQKSDV